MLAEHEEGRRYVRGLAEATERYSRGERAAVDEIVHNARGYADLLAQHIQKEDNIMYEIADARLSPEDQHDLEQLFERLEQETIGPGGHERYVALVARLEQAVNGA